MIDAMDLELVEKTQPSRLRDLLESIDLVNMPIRVDRNNITGKNWPYISNFENNIVNH